MFPNTSQSTNERHVFLIGRPPIEEYLGYLIEQINSRQVSQKTLIDEWRSANDHVLELEKTEAGWADNPQITPLPTQLENLRTVVENDPIFQNSIANLLPTGFGMVELDRLVVFQKFINLEYVDRLKKSLGDHPNDELIFKMCQPIEHKPAKFMGRQIANNTFIYVSPSLDIRFLGVAPLTQENIAGYQSAGVLAGVIGLQVGFGSNYLHALQVENRLILNNGSHRAYALRELGIERVPCIIQQVSRRDELNLVAPQILQGADLYLQGKRPPVLKDYFDEKLRNVVSVPRKLRQVRVQFGVEVSDMPDMQNGNI
jgi:hypothetical protein